MTSEALATRGNTALANMPEYLKTQVGNRAGLENTDQTDLLIPRLVVTQQLHPQLKKSNENFIPGLEIGDIFNSANSRVYGAQVTVVPLYFFKQYIEFKPIEEGGGIVAQYTHAEDVPNKGLEFGTGEKGRPRVTEFKNWMCLLISKDEKPEPIVVSFKSSALKDCRRWNSFIRSTSLPAYAKYYTLDSIAKSKGSLEWNAFKITPGEFVPQDFFKSAEAFFGQLQARGAKMDTTGMTDATDNPDAEPSAF